MEVRMSALAPRDIARLVEFAEAEAWANCYLCASPEIIAALGPRARRIGPAWITMLQKFDSWFFNRIMAFGLDEAATESTLDEALRILESSGCGNYVVQLSPLAEPPELPDWLNARGMARRGSWAKMYRGNEPSPYAQTSLRIEHIGTEWAEAFGQIALDAFEMPAVLLPFMSCNIGKPGWLHYLGFDGNEPVSTAAMFISGDVGWLGVGSTLASHRGRGGQSAMFARRISDGLEAGCKWFVTETGEDTPESPNPSYHNMIRAGFKLAYLRPNYVRGER
jgi:hypothetical protein